MLTDGQVNYLKYNYNKLTLKEITERFRKEGVRNSKGNLRPNDISGYAIKKLGLRKHNKYTKPNLAPSSKLNTIEQILNLNVSRELKIKFLSEII